ncbi:PE-PGRS family protein [Rhodococcus sp. PSBB066]|nr:PE-PGRS family protein [Rhodococcus aetherivorans]QRI76766.1 PE-PGRS family protein [Rhodococcus aetherivorans]QSE60184.1 PE-PGRS family protein [Rhodococcus sp. PSBB066]QSE68511.1 PE-PGRS family protein [Rhodococcus sp. PSBB049]
MVVRMGHRITRRSLAAGMLGAGTLAALAAAPAAAQAPGECVRNVGGAVTVNGTPQAPPVVGYDGLRLLGVDGGAGNSCITNVGPGGVSVTVPPRPAAGAAGESSGAPVEMRVDGGNGNVAVTNLGVGTVTVDRDRTLAGPPPSPERPAGSPLAGLTPELTLDAGTDGVYVTNIGAGNVTIADHDPTVGPLPAELLPPGVVVTDPLTGNVFVTNIGGSAVTVVDRSGQLQRVVDRGTVGTAVDYGAGNVFVTNIGGGVVTVLRE